MLRLRTDSHFNEHAYVRCAGRTQVLSTIKKVLLTRITLCASVAFVTETTVG